MTPGFLTSIVVLLTTVVGAVSLVYKHFVGWTPRARERNALKKKFKKARKEYVEAYEKFCDAVGNCDCSDDELAILRVRYIEAAKRFGEAYQRL